MTRIRKKELLSLSVGLLTLSGALVALSLGHADDAVPAPTPSAAPSPAPTSAPTSAPLTLIRSDFAAGELASLCKAAMDRAQAKLDAIAALAPEARTFDNTMLALETVTAQLSDDTTPLTFMGYVSPNTVTNGEGSDCEAAVGEFNVAVFTRKDLYSAIKDQTPQGADQTRLLSETLKGFEANGLKLSDEQLAKVKDLKTKLSAKELQFSANLNNERSSVNFDGAELAGVSADFLARLKKTDDGKYIVTTKDTDYTQVMQNATSGETRRKMLSAYYNRAADVNVKLLEDGIALRQQIAAALGYATWADYRIHGRMAKDAPTVMSFLNGLKDKLAQRNRDDMNKLLAFKKESDPTATDVKMWDITYLSYQLKKRDYTLDDDKIREYFPADVVIAGLFDVYSRMLGVKYVEQVNAKTWSPDVKLYEIDDAKDGRLIGYFYTDFFPRPGKYGHAAAFPLLSARQTSDGYTRPVSSIVANLNPPAGGKPSLLNHDEVETIFHEFGHIMHQTLTRAPYASLSGSNVAQDFVEAPSQMLENWVWSADVLTLLSGHYLDHSQKLPAELLNKMIDAKDFNQGYYYTRQLMLALLDMTYHSTAGPVDTTEIQNRLYKDIIGIEPIAGGHFQASFGHLMGGYDAGYYGYLWSEVYAADMFTVFQKTGLLDPTSGARYRHSILERGSMVDATDLLRDFLGRDSNQEAFFRKLHIGR